MPTAKANGINIYYEIHGKGEPLVLISGGGGDSSFWIREVPVFSKKYKVIVFDNRGTGRSDKPDMPYTMKMMAADTAGLLDAIGIDAAHIYGVSMGGGVAQEFALSYPEKVISLILGCTSSGGAGWVGDKPLAGTRISKMTTTGMTKESLWEAFRLYYPEEIIEANKKQLEEYLKVRLQHPTPARTYINQGNPDRGFDFYDRLPNLKVPTLVIHGTADKVVNFKNAEILAARIPNSELVFIEKAGHVYTFGVGPKPQDTVLDFLRRHPRTAK